MTGHGGVSRRVVLRSAGAGVLAALGGSSLAGCTPRSQTSQQPVGVPQPTDASAAMAADQHLLAAALADEYRLLVYCSAVERRYPKLAAAARSVSSVQREHVTVLQRALGHPPATRGRLPLPHGAKAAEARLVRELHGAHDRRTSDCLAAVYGPVARLFASTAASHAMTLAALSAP